MNSHLTWENTSTIPEFGRQKQEDLCKFKARLGYLVNSRSVKMAQGNSVSNQQTKSKNYVLERQMALWFRVRIALPEVLVRFPA